MFMDWRIQPSFYAPSVKKYQTICFPRKSFWKSLLVSQKCTFAPVPASVLFRRISPLQRSGIRSRNNFTKCVLILWTRGVFIAVCISWGRVWGPNHLSTMERLYRKVVLSPPPKKNIWRESFYAEWTSIFDSMAVELWIISIVDFVYSSLTPILKRGTELHAVKAVFLGSRLFVYNNSNSRRWCGEFYGYERIPRFIS